MVESKHPASQSSDLDSKYACADAMSKIMTDNAEHPEWQPVQKVISMQVQVPNLGKTSWPGMPSMALDYDVYFISGRRRDGGRAIGGIVWYHANGQVGSAERSGLARTLPVNSSNMIR